jgi:hypothetical protein
MRDDDEEEGPYETIHLDHNGRVLQKDFSDYTGLPGFKKTGKIAKCKQEPKQKILAPQLFALVLEWLRLKEIAVVSLVCKNYSALIVNRHRIRLTCPLAQDMVFWILKRVRGSNVLEVQLQKVDVVDLPLVSQLLCHSPCLHHLELEFNGWLALPQKIRPVADYAKYFPGLRQLRSLAISAPRISKSDVLWILDSCIVNPDRLNTFHLHICPVDEKIFERLQAFSNLRVLSVHLESLLSPDKQLPGLRYCEIEGKVNESLCCAQRLHLRHGFSSFLVVPECVQELVLGFRPWNDSPNVDFQQCQLRRLHIWGGHPSSSGFNTFLSQLKACASTLVELLLTCGWYFNKNWKYVGRILTELPEIKTLIMAKDGHDEEDKCNSLVVASRLKKFPRAPNLQTLVLGLGFEDLEESQVKKPKNANFRILLEEDYKRRFEPFREEEAKAFDIWR